ncbi:hypothetical protein LTR72_005624 [Exophiala xenobiotica]|nr:hypothetical protein LTR72_005624 [Exophiala xenobiotica]KAK5297394.1 hypothetical protein LTR14_003125 [Exophiala xenobiotica]KAK5485788.1 hypothetical protein LTR55_005466 [Exophiala xenobiotica]
MVSPGTKTETISDSTALEDEKPDIACHENSLGGESPAIDDKKLLRRIDLHIVTWLAILYAFSLLDRTNIGSAKVAGMEVDLELTGNRYSIVSLMLFPTYILLDVPSNMFIRRVSVRTYLAFFVFCWGVLAMCCGFVNDWKDLIAVRVLLGAFEGAFQRLIILKPTCSYIISSWYKRYETHQRIAIWYMSGAFLNGFQGIISYALSLMEGVGGLRGWRWIFIIPGLVTAVLALPVYRYVSEFPESAKWLKPHELRHIQERLHHDRGEVEEKMDRHRLFAALSDWRCWALALLLFWSTAGSYSLSFFLPSILRGFGFSTALSQILVTPPMILSVFCSVGTGLWADRVHIRSPFIVGHMVLVIVGIVLIGWGTNLGSRLVGVFLMTIGNNCTIPTIIAFLINNVPSSSKRQIALPLQGGSAGLGGIAGALIFRTQDAPRYLFGLYLSIAFACCSILMTSALVFYFHRENRKVAEGGPAIDGIEGFRYTL